MQFIVLVWLLAHLGAIEDCNESYSKNPDIKTPLVSKNEKQLSAKNSPLTVVWCQGSSKDLNNPRGPYRAEHIMYFLHH